MSKWLGINLRIRFYTNEFKKKIKEIQLACRGLDQELRRNKQLLRLDPQNASLWKQQIELATSKVKNLQTALAAAEKELKRKQDTGSKTYKTIQKDVENLKFHLKKANLELGASQNKLKGLSQVSESLSKHLSTVKNLFRVTAFATVFAARGAIGYEEAIGKVYTIVKKNDYELNKFRKNIDKLSLTYGVARAEMAEGWYFMLSSGVKATKAMTDEMKFMDVATRLTITGFGNMASVVKALAGVMNAYNFTAEQAEKTAGVLLATQNKGIITVHEMSQFMGKATPIAAQLGVTLEEVGAGMAVLTRNGLPASRASTFLNRLFTDLAKNGTEVSVLLKEKTGKSFKELIADGKNLGNVLSIIEAAGKEAGAEFYDIFSSIRAATGAMGVFNNEGKTFQTVLSQIKNQADTELKRVYEQYREFRRFSISLNKVKIAMTSLGIGAAETLNVIFTGFNKLTFGIQNSKSAITAFGVILTSTIAVAGLLKFIAVWKSLLIVLKASTVAMALFKTAAWFMTSWRVILVGAIALLATIPKVMDTIGAAFEKVFGWAIDAVQALTNGLKWIWEALSGIGGEINEAVGKTNLRVKASVEGSGGVGVTTSKQYIENVNINVTGDNPGDIAEKINEQLNIDNLRNEE